MDPARDAKLSTWLNDQRVRGLIYQTLLLACVSALACGAIYNARDQYARPRHSDGLRILERSRRLRHQSPPDRLYRSLHLWPGLLGRAPQYPSHRRHLHSAGDAAWVLRSASPGFRPIGCCRDLRSSTPASCATSPLLLLLLFWYNAVLKSLPGPRQSISIGDVVFLNNRGLYLPMPVPRDQAVWFVGAIARGLGPRGRISRVGATPPGAHRRASAERPVACRR